MQGFLRTQLFKIAMYGIDLDIYLYNDITKYRTLKTKIDSDNIIFRTESITISCYDDNSYIYIYITEMYLSQINL